MKKMLIILPFCLLVLSGQAQVNDPFTGKPTKTTVLKNPDDLPSFEDFCKNFDKQAHAVTPIEPYDLKSLMETRNLMFLIDLRTEAAFDISHISGAKQIDYNTFTMEQVWALDKNTAIILYCNLGDERSIKVAAYMQSIGFLDVRVLKKGMIGWVNTRYLVVDKDGKAAKTVLVDSKTEAKKLKKAKAIYK